MCIASRCSRLNQVYGGGHVADIGGKAYSTQMYQSGLANLVIATGWAHRLADYSLMPGRVVALLPNAGLANKLFVWAKAEVFAQLNDMPNDTIGWTWPKIGPLLRGERNLRMYGRYFRSRKNDLLIALATGSFIRRIVIEPEVGRLPRSGFGSRTYVFKDIPSWRDLFGDIRNHRDFIRDRLLAMIRDQYKKELDALRTPIVSVHVRRGDFRRLRLGEDFALVGGVRTADQYFADLIEQIRYVSGRDLPITVFSDGSDDEVAFLTRMPGVTRSPATSDVVDLLLMARSRIIITSAGSTFGEWAAFLSQAAVLRHPARVLAPIRPPQYTELYYEGPAPAKPRDWSGLLLSNVREIRPG